MTAEPDSTLSVETIIDGGARFGRYQMMIAALCMSCLILDGFDLQTIAYVAPVIIREWGIDRAQLTPVFSAGLAGMLIGSFALSWLADRIGRKAVLVGATVFFSICMLVTSQVNSIGTLMAIRFVTGVGLGGIMPNAMSLAGEFSPKRHRVTVMMLVASGFTIGAISVGVFSAVLLDVLGWRGIFIAGGMMPLLLSIVMLFHLPESPYFSLSRGRSHDQIARILQRIRPDWALLAGQRLALSALDDRQGRIGDLFARIRRRGTFVLFGLNIMNLIVLSFLSSWLPTLLAGAGYSQTVSIAASTLVPIGGVVGTLTMGRFIDRIGFHKVLIPVFLLAAIAVALSGMDLGQAGLFITVAIAGFCIVGGQPALNSMAANFYPASIRSTGIGWSLGVGRFGSVLGPALGGLLIARGWPNPALFTALAVPALISMALMFLMPRVESGAV